MKETLRFAPIYLWLSYLNFAVKFWRAPVWDSVLEVNHQLLLRFHYTNNEQSRLLQFYVPEALHRVFGLSVPHAYGVARVLFVFLAFLVFHRFLRRWFTAAESLAGVAVLSCVLAFTHQNDLQESAPLLLLVFIVAQYAIRDGCTGWMLASFFVGGLTNETSAILPSVYFFYHVRFDRLRNVLMPAAKACVSGLPLMLTLIPIRWYNRDRPVLGRGFHWPDNIEGILREIGHSPLDILAYGYVLFLVAFLGLTGLVASDWKSKPLFLTRAAWMIPLFVLAHLITGRIDEPRQMVPLGFVIIPLALCSLSKISGEKRSDLI